MNAQAVASAAVTVSFLAHPKDLQAADAVHVVCNNNICDFVLVAAERLRRKPGQGTKLPEPSCRHGLLL